MKNLKEAIANFISEHPWMTFFTVTALIEAPANIIKAFKWDGHYANSTSYISTVSDDTSTEESE